MSQSTQKPLLTDALACWYKADAPDAANILGSSLNSQREHQYLANKHCHSVCTGHTFHDDELQVLVVGAPRFSGSDTDTPAQTLANEYRTHGEAVLDQLTGAFSFCLYDVKTDTLIAATDRFGQHPIYYAKQPNGNGIIVASSASAVLAHPELKRELTAQGVYDYIYFHMVPSPVSVYQGLSKLPGAHRLTFTNGQINTRCYWIPQFKEHNSNAEASLEKELKHLLRESVRKAGGEGDKVGAFLSGGLDSSTVVGMLSEIRQDTARAFSIGFSAEGYDEMAFARITAKHFGVELNEYYVTPEDVVTALPLVATSYDEPFGNSSALPAYFCAKVAKESGIDHLLAGDGGDEFFAGNERYAKQQVFDHYQNVPRFLRTGLLEPLIKILPNALPLVSKASSYITQANTPLPDRMQSYNFLHRHTAEEIFSDDLIAEINTESPLALQREIYHRPDPATSQNRMLYLDWQYTLADNDLRKVSHMCALAGVNVSYPMLDDALVDFSLTVPSEMKLANGELRRFYKNALRNWLPDETINKSKQGFGLPFGVWMREHKPLRDMAYDNLLSLKKRGFLRAEFIDKTIELHRSGHASYYGELVWILTVFEIWMTTHDNS